MKSLLILILPLVLFAQNYMEVGNYRIYPYSPTGLSNWPTGYLSVTVDSSNAQIAVDSVGNGETYQALKSPVLERFMRKTFAFLDSFYVYEGDAWALKDPVGVGYYSSTRQILGIQGDMIRAYVETYKATKESKYMQKAVRLWEQIQDSSYIVVYNRSGDDSMKVQKWRPEVNNHNTATEYNIAVGMNDLYELVGTQEWNDYARKLYDVMVTWNDTVDAVGDTIRNFNLALYAEPDANFRYNYGCYGYFYLMYATAKGWGNHSVSGDSLLYNMENYFRGGIDSTTQLRKTTPVSGGNWYYTGMELAYDMDGQRYMKAAGYAEPYWNDWQYLVDGMFNESASDRYRDAESVYGTPIVYFLADNLGYDTQDDTRPAQAVRALLNHIYVPIAGYSLNELGMDYDYGWRYPFWNIYYNMRYLKNYTNPISAMPALKDSLWGSSSWDLQIYQAQQLNFPYLAAITFDLADFDSMVYSVDNDSSILSVSYYHGDTTCTINRLSNSYLMQIECSHPTGLIIKQGASTGIYDATAHVFADTADADTSMYLANMPTGKDTVITYDDSTVVFLFDTDEYMIIKSDVTDWTYNIDNETITSDPITDAFINATDYGLGNYVAHDNRNKFINYQKRIINWLYTRRLSRLAMGYTQ